MINLESMQSIILATSIPVKVIYAIGHVYPLECAQSFYRAEYAISGLFLKLIPVSPVQLVTRYRNSGRRARFLVSMIQKKPKTIRIIKENFYLIFFQFSYL